MKTYVTYDADGNITSASTSASDDAIEVPPGMSGTPSMSYVVNGELVAYTQDQAIAKAGQRPPAARWSNAFMAWIDTRTLDDLKAGRWVLIKSERAQKDAAPITVGGLTLDADQKARESLMGAVLEMQATGRQTRRWTLADNTRQHLTLEQLVSIGSAIADRTEALQNASQDMREQINAAQTAAQVEAVVWPQGV